MTWLQQIEMGLGFIFQALSLVEQEKSTLGEKLANTLRDLATLNLDYDRLKRDSIARQEQDRTSINQLNNELKNFRAQFEETTWVGA